MIDLTNMFREQHWRRFRIEKTRPHSLYVAQVNNGKVAVLVLRRKPDRDWVLNADALKFLATALRDGRIAEAHIVAAAYSQVVVQVSVPEMVARIGDMEPNDGDWGPYFWLDAELKPVGNYRTAEDDEEPF